MGAEAGSRASRAGQAKSSGVGRWVKVHGRDREGPDDINSCSTQTPEENGKKMARDRHTSSILNFPSMSTVFNRPPQKNVYNQKYFKYLVKQILKNSL